MRFGLFIMSALALAATVPAAAQQTELPRIVSRDGRPSMARPI